MTQSILRKKNLIFLLDALWGTDYEQDKPVKWKMAPFNNTYSSSVFASFDNVAIESVGYDFLRSEFTVANVTGKYAFVQMRGADDYLHQAADSTNWPVGIKYDPDSTGVHIFSLGVHEHWNNAIDKKYTKNLGIGKGIELFSIEQGVTTGVAYQEPNAPKFFELYQNYPNPFNPSTTIEYRLTQQSSVSFTVYNLQGREITSYSLGVQAAGPQKVVWNGTQASGTPRTSGVYVYRLRAVSVQDGTVFDKSAKMVLLK
jgi:hypothetical protein